MRRDQMDKSKLRAGADWCYYNPYTRRRTLEREYRASWNPPRSVSLVNISTCFHQDVKIIKCEEN